MAAEVYFFGRFYIHPLLTKNFSPTYLESWSSAESKLFARSAILCASFNKNNFTAHYLGHPAHFNKSVVDERFFASGAHFDILTHHSRFDPRGVDQIMPPDTKKCAILREPTALFESLYGFYRMSREGYPKFLGELLDFDVEELKTMAQNYPRFKGKIGFNQVKKSEIPKNILAFIIYRPVRF